MQFNDPYFEINSLKNQSFLFIYLIFLLWRYWDISTYSVATRCSTPSEIFIFISFLNSLIFNSFNFSYFSFYFRSIIFFYSSFFFSLNSVSIAWILSCQDFYVSFLWRYKSATSSSSWVIISGVTSYKGLFFFNFCWPAISFCSRSLTLFCFRIYCSWFFLRILSDSISLSFKDLDSSLAAVSYFFRSSIFSSYSSSLFKTFKAFVCSFFIFNKLFFYSSKVSSSFRRYLS